MGLPQGVSVFLDGVRQNEPDAAQVNFDLLPMQYVRRIELLSGTASLAGRNTLGGAINLVTARGRGPIGGELEVQGGSFDTFNGNGSVSGVTRGRIDYYVGAGYNREDGWRQGTGAEQYNGFFNVGRLAETWGISLQGFGANSYAEPAGSLPESVFDVKPDSNLTTGDFDDIDLIQLAVTGYRQLGTGPRLVPVVRPAEHRRAVRGQSGRRSGRAGRQPEQDAGLGSSITASRSSLAPPCSASESGPMAR